MYKWEKIDKSKVNLEVEVPKEEVNEALDQAYRKVVKKVDLPGFRKGKIPRKILENRFGPEILYEDALEILVDPAYAKAIAECDFEPINQPELEEVQIEKDKPLVFKVTVDVKPDVELGEYKGVTVEHESKTITEEDVDRYMESLREQHARLVTRDDVEVQGKDLAVIDFKGTIDGEPFAGGEGENYSLEIGSETFIPGFEEQLVGACTGEDREIQVTFPEDYQVDDLAGKEAVFHVKVNEIKRPELPELNDEFVQELTEEFSTMEEFRADVQKKLTEETDRREKIELESKVIEKVAEETPVEVPEVLVQREINNILGEFEYYLRMQGLSLEQYGNLIEGGLEQLKEERREDAEKRARANLVLDAIIKKEEITASLKEIDAKIEEIAQKHDQDLDVEEIKEQFAKQGRLDMIAHELRYRKAIDLLVEHANIIDPAASAEAGHEVVGEGAEEAVQDEKETQDEAREAPAEQTDVKQESAEDSADKE